MTIYQLIISFREQIRSVSFHATGDTAAIEVAYLFCTEDQYRVEVRENVGVTVGIWRWDDDTGKPVVTT